MGRITPARWLPLPLLFVCCTGGVVALLELTMTARPWYSGDVSLSAPLVFGCAAALALVTGSNVTWGSPAQRYLLLPAYPMILLGCALGFDDVHVPMLIALTAGGVAAALLVVLYSRLEQDTDGCR